MARCNKWSLLWKNCIYPHYLCTGIFIPQDDGILVHSNYCVALLSQYNVSYIKLLGSRLKGGNHVEGIIQLQNKGQLYVRSDGSAKYVGFIYMVSKVFNILGKYLEEYLLHRDQLKRYHRFGRNINELYGYYWCYMQFKYTWVQGSS